MKKTGLAAVLCGLLLSHVPAFAEKGERFREKATFEKTHVFVPVDQRVMERMNESLRYTLVRDGENFFLALPKDYAERAKKGEFDGLLKSPDASIREAARRLIDKAKDGKGADTPELKDLARDLYLKGGYDSFNKPLKPKVADDPFAPKPERKGPSKTVDEALDRLRETGSTNLGPLKSRMLALFQEHIEAKRAAKQEPGEGFTKFIDNAREILERLEAKLGDKLRQSGTHTVVAVDHGKDEGSKDLRAVDKDVREAHDLSDAFMAELVLGVNANASGKGEGDAFKDAEALVASLDEKAADLTLKGLGRLVGLYKKAKREARDKLRGKGEDEIEKETYKLLEAELKKKNANLEAYCKVGGGKKARCPLAALICGGAA